MTGPPNRKGAIVVVGGAGFIGCNLADYFAQCGQRVRVLDNLARRGSERNALWLKERHGQNIEVVFGDIGEPAALEHGLGGASAVFHLAAQVAVTTSIETPLADFQTNVVGTLKILEWLRTKAPETPLIFASTNKVYGCLESVGVVRCGERYQPLEDTYARFGINEEQPLSFQTPYGCSKGAADQYVLEYARAYGMRTAVLRMSCIYGPRQFGNEDQGWVAHFLLQALAGRQITIYGDGAQVRDILHVRDAVEAYRLALENIDSLKGEAFNLGGGPENAISLRELLQRLDELNATPDIRFASWRAGDQPWFVADTRKFSHRMNWKATTYWRDGLDDLTTWARSILATQPATSPSREARA